MTHEQTAAEPWLQHQFRRAPVWAVIAAGLVLAVLCWAAAGWRLTERQAVLDLEGRSLVPGWSLRWAGPSGANGVWLNLSEAVEGETLEIEIGDAPPGQSDAWQWLYRVSVAQPDGSTVDIPLKPLADTADEAVRTGPWRDFTDGPGIVYGGAPGGRLRLQLPAGPVTIYTARTPTSGTLIVRYAGEEHRFDANAPAVESLTIPLRRRLIPDARYPARRVVVPARGIESLELVGGVGAWGGLTAYSAVIETRIAGMLLARQPVLWRGDDAAQDAADGPNQRVTAEGGAVASVERQDDGVVRLRAAMPRTPIAVRLAGLGVIAACVVVCTVAAWLLIVIRPASGARAAPAAGSRPSRQLDAWFWTALAVIVGVRIWMAWWAPPLLTADSFDYIVGGARFFETGDWSVFGGWRVPGYGLFLGIFWTAWPAWAVAAAAGQAALGVVTAVLCRSMLLRIAPAAWATAAMLLVGLDPELLAFERIMLSEALSAFLLTLIAWIVVRNTAPRGWGMTVVSAVVIGLCCAALVYVRANFQTMVLLAPAGLLFAVWRTRGDAARAIICAAVAGVVMIGGIAPWLVRNTREYNETKMVVRSEFAKVVFLWNNRDFDMNQTAVHTYADFKRLRDRRGAGMEVWGYTAELSEQARRDTNGEPASVYYDRLCGVLAAESLARRPFDVLQSSGKALATQLGLWVQGRLTGNQANAELAAPFRGTWQHTAGNILFDASTLSSRWDRELVGEVINRAAEPIAPLKTSPHAGTFDDLFGGYRFLRPLLAALMIIGGVIALRRWDRVVVIVVMIATANAAALAVLLYCPLERYRIAITPLIAVAAVYALYRLAAWSRRSA